MIGETQQEKKLIMIAEDDVFIGDIYEVKLKDAGYDVVLANNGREAIEKLESGIKPHIMLLDIVMPYMGGMEVLKKIKEDEKTKKIPVVLLTNLSQKEDIDLGLGLGASDYLIKSHFTLSEVLEKIRIFLPK